MSGDVDERYALLVRRAFGTAYVIGVASVAIVAGMLTKGYLSDLGTGWSVTAQIAVTSTLIVTGGLFAERFVSRVVRLRDGWTR